MNRALILLEQSRYDLAEREIRRELAANPDDPAAHALLSLCLAQVERFEEATAEAEAAVRLAPDLAFAHYALASVADERGDLRAAETAIAEAIRLDPEDADHFAVLAQIRLNQRRWRDALSAAEQGLAIDPEHVGSTNLRAMALVKLGRKEEAGATIEAALSRDPENAVTHANQGWSLLHQADYLPALAHFREALRLDPQLEWARLGMVEALKAKHLLYGVMLRYFLWMSRLSGRAQWAVVLGGFLGYRLLRDIARANPGLAPWITPVLIAYGLFAVLTWIADPLFSLVLRLNRFGRLTLSEEQIAASNWLGGCLLAALIAGGAWLASGRSAFLTAGVVLAALALPIAGTFRCEAGWPRKLMAAYTALVAAAGLISVGFAMAGPSRLQAASVIGGLSGSLLVVSVVGSLLSGWAANGLAMVRPRR